MMHSSKVPQVFGLLALAWALQVTTAKLASYVSACSVNDPELNECILKQGLIFHPSIVKGIKEFGLPSLDPLQIPLMRIEEGNGGSVGLAFNITDSKHYGWPTNLLTKINADPKNHHFELFLSNPKYTIIGNYEIKGRLLILPIVGSGFTNMTIENVNTSVTLDGELEQRGGEQFLKLTNVKCTFSITDIHIRFDNLFGNKQLSDAMNMILNQNGKEAFAELKPAIGEAFSEIYLTILGRLFSKVPYNQLFKLD